MGKWARVFVGSLPRAPSLTVKGRPIEAGKGLQLVQSTRPFKRQRIQTHRNGGTEYACSNDKGESISVG